MRYLETSSGVGDILTESLLKHWQKIIRIIINLLLSVTELIRNVLAESFVKYKKKNKINKSNN